MKTSPSSATCRGLLSLSRACSLGLFAICLFGGRAVDDTPQNSHFCSSPFVPNLCLVALGCLSLHLFLAAERFSLLALYFKLLVVALVLSGRSEGKSVLKQNNRGAAVYTESPKVPQVKNQWQLAPLGSPQHNIIITAASILKQVKHDSFLLRTSTDGGGIDDTLICYQCGGSILKWILVIAFAAAAAGDAWQFSW